MAARKPRKPKPPKPKTGGQGRRDRGARGRTGSTRPPSAAIYHHHPTHGPARSARHDPAGSHLPEEMVGGFHCRHCGYPGWREHRVVTKEGALHATLAFAGCTNCGTLHPIHVGAAAHANHVNAKTRVRKRAEVPDAELPDVMKTVDATETAAQRQDLEGGLVGHRKGCPRGGTGPCGRDVDGRCAVCDIVVRDHEAIGKTISPLHVAVADVRKLAGLG